MKKHTHFKRTIASVLTVILLFGAAPLAGFAGMNVPDWLRVSTVTASAASEDYVDASSGLKFSIDGTGATITGYETAPTGHLVIPETVKNGTAVYTVTAIGSKAFKGCTSITELTIPVKVSKLGEYVFNGCSLLKTVNWNSPQCEIYYNSWSSGADGYYAPFEKCDALTKVVFGENVLSIPGGVCKGIPSLETVVFQGRVTSIGYASFWGCSALKQVDLSYVASISGYAFGNCSALQNPVFSQRLTTIGTRAYNNCSSITEITIPAKVSSLGEYVFNGCSMLKKVRWNSPQCEIYYNQWSHDPNGYYAPFENCVSLTAIEFGENVTAIPGGVGKGITNLQTIIFRGNTSSIGYSAFWGDDYTEDIYFAGAQADWDAMIDNTADGNDIIKNSKPAALRTEENRFDNAWYHLGELPIETYTLTWVVDGETVKTETLVAGAAITAPAVAPRDGFTFAWQSYPATMPAKNLTVTGSYTAIPTYTVKWIVDGVETTASYPAGAAIVKPADPVIEGMVFKGWTPDVPVVMPARDLTFTAVFDAAPADPDDPAPTVSIQNYRANRSEAYKTTITFTAVVTDAPADAQVHWFVDGKDTGVTGEKYTNSQATASYSVQAKLMQSDTILAESKTEKVEINSGLFARLIAIFRQLFSRLPVISQAMKETF